MNTEKTKVSTKGFSLIELMVVIAIVALISAVAVPSYKQYISRSKVAEINTLIGDGLAEWVENYSLNDTAADTTNTPGSYIASIVVTNTAAPISGTDNVVVTLNSDTDIDTSLDSLELTYTPSETGGDNISWACEYTGAEDTDVESYFTDCTPSL